MSETNYFEEVNQPPSSCLCKILPRFLDCPNSYNPLNLGFEKKNRDKLWLSETRYVFNRIEYSPFKSLVVFI